MHVIPLIPRQTFFSNPDYLMVRLSPNGKRLSFIAPHNDVLNIWVSESTDPKSAQPITHDTKRGIRNYVWSYTNEHILYTQDQDGDENWHVYCIDLQSGEIRDLTPFPQIHARFEQVSPFFPQEIIIAINKRVPELHDLYRVNIVTGELSLLYENHEFAGFVMDDQLNLRFAFRINPNGDNEMLQKGDNEWQPFLTIAYEDILTTTPLGFNKEKTQLYMIDSRERDTAALVSLDLHDQSTQLIAQDAQADIADVLIHPTEKNIQGMAANYDRKRWQFLDAKVQKDLEYIRQQTSGDLEITSRTLADDQWIIAVVCDDRPAQFYHFERQNQKLTYLFSMRQALEGLPLCSMRPVIIPARDGLQLVCYLTTPHNAGTQQPFPLILHVHGGPQARDVWGCDPIHQWLANRGYAVLSVNYRGSTGFGKNFINIADGQFSRAMHDDLLDAVNWTIQEGIADRNKVAIMGGSYGGYATLVGLTFTPDVFACGVDIVGPSNLATLLATIPPYWKPILDAFKRRLGGDPESAEGIRELEARSPLFKHEQIKKPLLIGQGANDPRVKQAESDQIVAALKSKNIPVTYVLYPDEGHGFARPENRMSFYAITEAFLAEHLGGRKEPIDKDFRGSSLQILEGAEVIDGLAS